MQLQVQCQTANNATMLTAQFYAVSLLRSTVALQWPPLYPVGQQASWKSNWGKETLVLLPHVRFPQPLRFTQSAPVKLLPQIRVACVGFSGTGGEVE